MGRFTRGGYALLHHYRYAVPVQRRVRRRLRAYRPKWIKNIGLVYVYTSLRRWA